MKKILSGLTVFIFLVTLSSFTALPARADTFWNSQGNDIYNTNYGDVGIGIADPLDNLHVYEVGTGPTWRGRGIFSGQTNAVVLGEFNGMAVVGGHSAALNAWSNLSLNFGGGNVGVGTLDPDAKLDLVNNPGSANNLALATNAYPNAYRWRINTIDRGMAIDLDITASDGSDIQEAVLQLSRSNSGRPELRIENDWLVVNNGNIGIGGADPDAKLDIFGNSSNATNLILSANYANSYRWRMNTVDRGGAIDLDFTASNANDTPETVLQLSRSNTGRPELTVEGNWLVVNNGNVGIGTNNPTEKLEVSGNVKTSGLLVVTGAPTLRIGDGSKADGGQIEWRVTSVSGRHWNIDQNGDQLRFFTENVNDGAGVPRAAIDENGTFRIDGTLKAKEIVVQTNVWADSVFAANYNLLNLSEVKQYIQDNNHLPGVPSEQEIKSGGVNLGTMDVTLLKKVEELTLYIIDFESRIKELESMNK